MIEPAFVKQQIQAVRDDIRIDAIKIGMLGRTEMVYAVAEAIDGIDAPVVLDTVMVAKGGDRLLEADAVKALCTALVSRATVITPNLPEAADLLGEGEVSDEDGMARQADALLDYGAKAVLLKGGHLRGERSRDVLLSEDGQFWLDGTRVRTENTHGTGCTLSSALAAQLGRGVPLPQAAKRAKAYVTKAIQRSGKLSVGQGYGPTHHFHKMWK